MFNNRKMNILKVYNYFDNIENVKSSQNRYVQYLFPFFQNSFLDRSEAKDNGITPGLFASRVKIEISFKPPKEYR